MLEAMVRPPSIFAGQVLGRQPNHSRPVGRDAMRHCERFRVCALHRVQTAKTKVALSPESALAERAEVGSVRHKISR
jgi:hypothetical protein